MSFPRYSRYKDSRIAWLGDIPEHWKTVPLKRLVLLQSGDMIQAERIEASGSYPVFGGNGIRGFAEDFNHEGNFVLIGRQGALCGNVSYAYGRFWASEHAVAAHPLQEFDTFWLGELLRAMNLGQYSLASAQPGLSVEAISRLHIPVPPSPEMQTISAFLQHETAKIDALIQEQQRLIELLKEKRQAVISHAVTKGLDPTVPMKDSGVGWLGSIPGPWSVVNSRRLFRVRNEAARPADRQLTASQKYGMIFQADFIEMEGRRVVEIIDGIDSLRHAEPNDFIISLRSFQGGLEWCKVAGSVTFHYVVLVPVKEVYEPFFAYLFKSVSYIQALRSTANLIRDGQDLRYSHFVLVDLPLVPRDEQVRIAAFLDAETGKIDALMSEVSAAISLLQERRSALISATVTGKIDVRNHTPRETTPVSDELYAPA